MLVIAVGPLSRSTPPLPDWLREYGGDTLQSMIMYGTFALLFPEARVKSPLTATPLFSYLTECSQLLDYNWFSTLCATPLCYLLGQDFVWNDLPCYSTGYILARSLDVMMLKRRRGICG